jgi:hypothetical protein
LNTIELICYWNESVRASGIVDTPSHEAGASRQATSVARSKANNKTKEAKCQLAGSPNMSKTFVTRLSHHVTSQKTQQPAKLRLQLTLEVAILHLLGVNRYASWRIFFSRVNIHALQVGSNAGLKEGWWSGVVERIGAAR